MNIKEQVYKSIASVLEVAEEDIKDDSHLVEDLGADSLDTVQLVMEIESVFDMEISDGVSINFDLNKVNEDKIFAVEL